MAKPKTIKFELTLYEDSDPEVIKLVTGQDKPDLTSDNAQVDFEVDLPSKFEVCPSCSGEGSIVNPSIDSHGLSREDFNEDPDFEEGYFSGRYDIQCPACKGQNVIAVLDEDKVHPKLLALYQEHQDDEASFNAMCEAERRMGC